MAALLPLLAADLDDAITPEVPSLEALYKHLHTHPELSFSERETAARIAQELRDAGYEVTTGVGGTGIVGVSEERRRADRHDPYRPRRPPSDRANRPPLREHGPRHR